MNKINFWRKAFILLIVLALTMSMTMVAFADEGKEDPGNTAIEKQDDTETPGTGEEPEPQEDPNLIDSGVVNDESGNSFTYKVIKLDDLYDGEKNYRLVISDGKIMPDFTKEYKAPWYEYRNFIHSVVIESGITYVGSYTFSNLYYLSLIDISKDVKTVGNHAFDTRDSYETKIKFSSKIRKIGSWAFAGVYLESKLILPDGLETLGSHAFDDCTEASKIVFPASIKTIGSSLISDWEMIGSIQYKGTKKQLYKVSIKKSGNLGLLRRKVNCSNGKTYFINNIKSAKITLSKKTFVYNGKKQTPKVTVKNALGVTMKKGKDYAISYSKSKRTKYGVYKIKIKPLKSGIYMGSTRSISYKIIPKAPKITYLTDSPYGGPYIEWKYKDYKKIDGYVIQYSTSSKFTKKTTLEYDEMNIVCGTPEFPGMKAGKTYYIRLKAWVNATNDVLESKYSNVVSYKCKKDQKTIEEMT
ncbi:MAG: leucine-rich repeat domain-containing protein [Firmicutes bacterium]|nr:leucine-rich repeat domain-containing protein [Bacillota bacterium]